MDWSCWKSNRHILNNMNRAKVNTNKKSLDELVKSADLLFQDDTVVLHVSGNKESYGRIVKSNQGLSKVFGYSKSEVTGHVINILMPSIFAKRHNDFLEKFFKTGYKTVFNKEREFYGLHRNGFCFHIKMLLKQMPSLEEGIQYVGMLRQTQSDADYIITDLKGVVDSFSSGVTSMLNLPIALFKDSDINIQILAPDLISVFSIDKKKMLLEKYKEIGGQRLTFYVPKDFASQVQSETKKNARDIAKTANTKVSPSPKKGKVPIFRDFNKDLNKHNGIAKSQVSTQQLLQSPEYKECESKQSIKCEIQDPSYGEEHKDIEPLKLRVFKLTGINNKRAGSNIELSSEADEFYRLASCSKSISSVQSPYPYPTRGENVPVPENREEINKGLINLMDDNVPKNKGKEEEKTLREDTKTTERLPGNVITTESRIETIEAKHAIISKFSSEGKKENDQIVSKEAKTPEKKEEKSQKQPISITSLNKKLEDDFTGAISKEIPKTGSLMLATPPEEKQIPSEPTTPKMDLGNIRGPDMGSGGSNIADVNTIRPKDDSGGENESKSSTIKAAAKENKTSEEQKPGSGSISNSERAKKKQNDNNTVSQEKDKKKEKKGGSYKDDMNLSDLDDINLKEVEVENKEEAVPLDKATIDKKIAQAAKLAPKSSSNLTEVKAGKQPLHVEKVGSIRKLPESSLGLKQLDSAKNPPESQQDIKKDTTISARRSIKEDFKKNEQQEKRNVRDRMRLNSKIITSPLYDGEGNTQLDIPEYHPSEDEIKLRKALLANERRKNKEKAKEENKEKSKEKKTETKKEGDDEEDEDNNEKDEKEEEDKEEENEEENKETANKKSKKKIQIEDLEDENQDTQSMTSVTGGSSMRSFFSLRAAIDEKFIPLSIRNMNCSAGIVFLLLLAIASNINIK